MAPVLENPPVFRRFDGFRRFSRACDIKKKKKKKPQSPSKIRVALYIYMSFSLEPLCHSFESNIYRPALRFVCAKLNSLPRRYTLSALEFYLPGNCIENCRHERFRSGINRSGLLITCCNTLPPSFAAFLHCTWWPLHPPLLDIWKRSFW